MSDQLNGGDLTASMAETRDIIAREEPDIGAWEHLDWDFVDRQVAELENLPTDQRGPLHGRTVGIKDIFDTADLPTAYGSEIYTGHQPAADAACVARLRAAGAVILGKTVSTEFAYWKAGKTRNPLDRTRTPGGSSSGSVAAVASGMASLAIGSQTAASTIRPASYCGIVGFKPTRGRISLAGAKALANSLDTVGAFAVSVADVGLISSVMMGDGILANIAPLGGPPNIGVHSTPEWDQVDREALAVVTESAARAEAAGADVNRQPVPEMFAPLAKIQTRVMAYEATRELAHERRVHAVQLSAPLLELFDLGDSIGAEEHARELQIRDRCLAELDNLFGQADIILAPSTLAEAPLLEDGTGNPDLSRAWTLLGLPSITIPCGMGPEGLPLGLQIAARQGEDARLLGAARWFEDLLRAGH